MSGEPPRWARLMRDLFERMPGAVSGVREKYLREDGSVLWPPASKIGDGLIDGLDDAYESFHSWPFAYSLGADERMLQWGAEGFDAVTRQFSKVPTGLGHSMVVNEYEQSYDWFHQGEGYLLFYHLCAAVPGLASNRERALKFAGFLLNEGTPEPNYDFEKRILRCPHLGSMGPGFRNFERMAASYLNLQKYYGLPFQGFEGLEDPDSYFADPKHLALFCEKVIGRLSRGDTATNLSSSSMAINAFLMTGDTRFRDWALDYIDGWMERAEANGGLIPDNVGLSGKVGEYMDGDWYGGHYGWVWPHGWHSLGYTVTIAMQNGLLLTGDSKYPAFLRRHLEMLADLGMDRDGTLHMPHKRTNPGWFNYDTSIVNTQQTLRDENGILERDGWFEFRPCSGQFPVWLWQMTGDPADEELMVRLRNHRDDSCLACGWNQIKKLPSKCLGGHEQAWSGYLRGEFPDYPEKILEHNLQQMDDVLEFIANDKQDPETYGDSYLQKRNPVSLEGIAQLTTGATMPVYNGGLMQTRLRFFDADRRRPGLPRDTAALVEGIQEEVVTLRIVNLHDSEPRETILRAGFYGEHVFLGCEIEKNGEFAGVPGDFPDNELRLLLPPRCDVRLRLRMKRFVNTPSAKLPDWE